MSTTHHTALEALRKLDGFTPQNLANTLWAYATLDTYPPHNLATAVCNATLVNLEAHCAHSLSTLMWSLSTLHHDPGAAFVSRVLARATCPEVLNAMAPQALALTLLGVGLFGYRDDALQRLLARARETAAAFDVQALANTLWACAMLRMVTPDTWNTLVAHFDPSRSVPTKRAENLRQIYQALLVATMDTGGALEGFKRPGELMEAAREAWLSDVSSVSVSTLQREVGAALTRLGFDPALEHVVADGAFSVDFAVLSKRLAVEVDGPHHFAVNTQRQLATTTTRHELLRYAGWTVLQVCFYDWQPLRGEAAAQEGLLTQLLAQHGIRVPAQVETGGDDAPGVDA